MVPSLHPKSGLLLKQVIMSPGEDRNYQVSESEQCKEITEGFKDFNFKDIRMLHLIFQNT